MAFSGIHVAAETAGANPREELQNLRTLRKKLQKAAAESGSEVEAPYVGLNGVDPTCL